MEWHTKTATAALEALGSREEGLTSEEAKVRQAAHGTNTLPAAKRKTWLSLFLEQFQSPIIYILLISAAIVGIMGDLADAAIILAVLVTNAIVGMIQEGRAQDTLAALQKFVTTSAAVLRDGREIILSDRELVPGDILMLREGDKVPADARLLRVNALKADESAITGESVPVHKDTEPVESRSAQAGEQSDMVFRGTYIVGGTAKALVVATGTRTLIGGISEKMQAVETEVPLRKNIRVLSRIIIKVMLAVSVFIFLAGLLYGNSLREMFLTVVAIAVSAIPEGLPVVVTLILATGVSRMSRRNALVKRLQAVEALGQAKVIAVDKTGTVTYNQMMVSAAYVNDRMVSVTGRGYDPAGEVEGGDGGVELLARVAAFTAKATVAYSEEEEAWKRLSGDPTEAALVVFARKAGFPKDELEERHPQTTDIPFDSSTKYHASVNTVDGKDFFSLAGAPEVVLSHCTHAWQDGEIHELSKEERESLAIVLEQLSERGLRVLGCAAHFDPPKAIDPASLPGLVFVGFVGIEDSIRPEAVTAVQDAQRAGIRVVMITGDYAPTAKAIAASAGIYREGDTVLSGAALDTMSEADLLAALDDVSVFARVTPEHKLSIVELYRKKGIVIAMTGDGVNDALSLAAADLGVSMGKTGTEVAKEASDIVLLDDNFGSIVAAVEEGRSIYRTIKKVILYLFSTSLGEVMAITAAMFMGLPLPVVASQIIWLNFVTDGFLVVALALEPKEKGLLKEPFRERSRHFVDRLTVGRMLLVSVVMTAGTIFLFDAYLPEGYVKASTVAMTALAVFQWFNLLNCRSEKKSVFRMNFFSNRSLVAAIAIVILLQMAAVYAPFFQNVLHTEPLSAYDWVIIIGVSASVIVAEEVRKLLSRAVRVLY